MHSVTTGGCLGADICNQQCVNAPDSAEGFVCTCYPGYNLNSDNHTCLGNFHYFYYIFD